MTENKSLRVHFMGIGGSGMSAVALLAHHEGYQTSGCDLQKDTPYLPKIKRAGISVSIGHDKSHLKNVDALVVTAAAFYQSTNEPEFIIGKSEKKLIKWQEFVHKYLHSGKKVISICGTNGKSTTTALASLVIEEAGLDPSAIVGATVKKWGAGYRAGKGKIFVIESDEFSDNYLAYRPDTIILNNIELDHPDYFKSLDGVVKSFARFLQNLGGSKILIFNQDDPGIKKLFIKLGEENLRLLNLIGYTLKSDPLINTPNSTRGEIIRTDPEGTSFKAINPKQNINATFRLTLPGQYNVSNALGVINLSSTLKISMAATRKVFETFEGIGRRLDKIGETDNQIIVYDDYGHHPTAIKLTLGAIKQRHPGFRILAVVEPSTFSRTKMLLPFYRHAFSYADSVIVTQIFKGRDSQDYGIDGSAIAKIAEHKNIRYIDNDDKIVRFVSENAKSKTVIVVFGAGNSYRLSRDIFQELGKN